MDMRLAGDGSAEARSGAAANSPRRRLASRLLLAGAVAPLAPRQAWAEAAAVPSAEVAYAVADLVACAAALRTLLNLVRYEDWRDAGPLVRRPPLSSFGASLATVADASELSPEQRASAVLAAGGVRERLSELFSAIRDEDRTRAMAAAREAGTGVAQIIAVCTSAGLL